MSFCTAKNLAAGGSRGSYAKSAGFRLGLGVFLQRLVFAIVAILVTAPAQGTNGFRETRPKVPPLFSPSGFSCTIVSRWFDQWGYRPVDFEVQAKNAQSKDREIEVTLYVTHPRQGDAHIRVSKSLVLRAGEKSVNAILLVPAVGEWDIKLDVAIDGKLDTFLSAGRTRTQGWSTAPQSSDLNLFTRTGSSDYSIEGLQVDTLLSGWGTSFGKDWLAFSGADVQLFNAKEIKTFAANRPEEFLTLRRWLMAGGTLWIEQVTNGKEGLVEIEQLFGADGWEFGITDEQGSKSVEGAPGWRYESLAKKASEGKQAIRELSEKILQGDLAGAASRLSGPDSRGWYAMRNYGFGRVMAFTRSPYNAPARVGDKKKQIAVSKWKDRNWPTRHGLSSDGASRSFGNWLIPGVGIAPVTEFQFLITLFVLGIGPLNYWLLRRSQRLHLLVLTTPLAALAVTVGLFAYALLSDGFGVKTRARSVTLLNQTSGEAVSWSRVTQYAASAPKGGYAFPDDAAVYPILPNWGVLGGQEKAAREIVWRDGEQQLVRGWLPTRTAVQHLIVRSHASSKEIRFSADGKEASNRLGADIELLLVQNEAGDWLHADDVAEGKAARLAPIKKTAAVVEMRKLVSENQPEFPVGAGDEAEEALDRFDFVSMAPSRRRRNRNRGTTDLSENLLNKAIARLSGLDGGEPLDLPPRSYVAVTYESVETPLGLKAAEGERIKETGSFHVTVGRW